MPVDSLVQFAWPPASSAPVRKREVVEYEQVPRAQRKLDLDRVDIQTQTLEEAQLRGQSVELHPT